MSGLGRLARRPRLRPRTEGERVEEGTRSFEGADGPMITATLVDGPLAGETIDIAIVEGRPPKTIDVPTRDGSACRYCLERLVQRGSSAVYSFVYRL